jgi:hypothetical protein
MIVNDTTDPRDYPGGSKPRVGPGPFNCTQGELLRRVEVWTDRQWWATPIADRPPVAVCVPGLGWVVALPVCGMN